MPERVDLVLFDLGGVLIEVSGVRAMLELTGFESEEELWRCWLTCRWVRRFESGGCSETEFAAGAVADWQLQLGVLKPDISAFTQVAGLLKVPAERVLFLDDNAVNVEGATAAGFQAARATGVGEARQRLAEAAVLGAIA